MRKVLFERVVGGDWIAMPRKLKRRGRNKVGAKWRTSPGVEGLGIAKEPPLKKCGKKQSLRLLPEVNIAMGPGSEEANWPLKKRKTAVRASQTNETSTESREKRKNFVKLRR